MMEYYFQKIIFGPFLVYTWANLKLNITNKTAYFKRTVSPEKISTFNHFEIV